MSEEINIKDLSTQELLELIQEDLYDGYPDEVVKEVQEALSRNIDPAQILSDGLIAGMDTVGQDFKSGELFVPEVLIAAKAMKAGMGILRPLLAESHASKTGTVVIGTVKGDLHDIGKNLVAMMLEGAGFEVINLGINNDLDSFVTAIKDHNPDIIGLSALLTTTMSYMQVIVDGLKTQNLRDNLIIMVGGAPLNDAYAERIGADAYCGDAAVAVDTAKKLMAIKKETGAS